MKKQFPVIILLITLIFSSCSKEPSLQDQFKKINISTTKLKEHTLYDYLQKLDQEKPIVILTLKNGENTSSLGDSLAMQAKENKLFSFIAINTDTIVDQETYNKAIEQSKEDFNNGITKFDPIFNATGEFENQFSENKDDNNYIFILLPHQNFIKVPTHTEFPWRFEYTLVNEVLNSIDNRLEGEYKHYYSGGQLELIINYKNGKEDGECKIYYSDGQLFITKNYINGKTEGEYKSYYANGQLKKIKNYKNGKEEGKYKKYHENGELYIEVNYLTGGKKEGEQKVFFDNGQLKELRTFINGKEEGEIKKYFKDGELALITNFKNGKEDGEFKRYYDNGQIKEIKTFKNGKVEGEYKSYYDNGQIKEIKTFKNGKVEGEFKSYYDNGQLKEIGTSKNGKVKGEFKMYYDNGQLNTIGNFENGKVEGEVKAFFEDGNLKSIENWKEGKLEGEYKSYHDNGQLNRIKFYKNGKEEGEYKDYFDNGQLNRIYFYENGKSEGEFKSYYKNNGELCTTGKYENGKKNGEWKTYNDNGQLYDIGNFVNGELDGEWKLYYDNGQLSKLMAWKKGKLIDIYSCFDKKGKAIDKGTLVNGNGTVFTYDDKGKLTFTRNYINGGEEEGYQQRIEDEAYFTAITKTKIKLKTPEKDNSKFSLTEYDVKKYAISYKDKNIISIPFMVPEEGEINFLLQNNPSWKIISGNIDNQARRFLDFRTTKNHNIYIDDKKVSKKEMRYVSQGGNNLIMENLRGKTCYFVAEYPKEKYNIYNSNYSIYLGYYLFNTQEEIDAFNDKLEALK